MAAILLLASCKTSSKVERIYIHDTSVFTKYQVDSVDRWHTHYEYRSGDTLRLVDTFYNDRWHRCTDTIYRYITNTEWRAKVEEKEKNVYVWWPGAILAIFAAIIGFKIGEFFKK